MNIARTITHFVERLAQRLQIFSVHRIVIEEVDSDFPGNALFRGEMVLHIIEQAVERREADRLASETRRLERFHLLKNLFMLCIDFREIDHQSLRQQTGIFDLHHKALQEKVSYSLRTV